MLRRVTVQGIKRLVEIQALSFPEKSDNVAALAAAVAMKFAGYRIDRERGYPLVMERTESDKVVAGWTQLNIPANYLNDWI